MAIGTLEKVRQLFNSDSTVTCERFLESSDEDVPSDQEIKSTIENSFQEGTSYTTGQVDFAAKYSVEKDTLNKMVGGVILRRMNDEECLFQFAMDAIAKHAPEEEVIKKAAQFSVSKITQRLDKMFQSGEISRAIYEMQRTNTERNLATLMQHYNWTEDEIDTAELKRTFEGLDEYFSERDKLFKEQTSFSGLPWYRKIINIELPSFLLFTGGYGFVVGTQMLAKGETETGIASYALGVLSGVILYFGARSGKKRMENLRINYYMLNELPNEFEGI